MGVDLPEDALVARSRDGDLEAFTGLVEAYQSRIYNLAFRLVGNREDAGDMAQEVFIRAFMALKGFKGRASFSTWLYRVAANVCLDELRRRRRQPVTSLDATYRTSDGDDLARQVADPAPGPEELAEREEVQRAVQLGIRSLTPAHRLVVVLRDIQGLTYQEMSQALGVSVGTVKSRLNRARESLRHTFAGRELLGRAAVCSGEGGEKA
jgi:RNA polymerase sigma-70 factor (ECF subfamily)